MKFFKTLSFSLIYCLSFQIVGESRYWSKAVSTLDMDTLTETALFHTDRLLEISANEENVCLFFEEGYLIFDRNFQVTEKTLLSVYRSETWKFPSLGWRMLHSDSTIAFLSTTGAITSYDPYSGEKKTVYRRTTLPELAVGNGSKFFVISKNRGLVYTIDSAFEELLFENILLPSAPVFIDGNIIGYFENSKNEIVLYRDERLNSISINSPTSLYSDIYFFQNGNFVLSGEGVVRIYDREGVNILHTLSNVSHNTRLFGWKDRLYLYDLDKHRLNYHGGDISFVFPKKNSFSELIKKAPDVLITMNSRSLYVQAEEFQKWSLTYLEKLIEDNPLDSELYEVRKLIREKE